MKNIHSVNPLELFPTHVTIETLEALVIIFSVNMFTRKDDKRNQLCLTLPQRMKMMKK